MFTHLFFDDQPGGMRRASTTRTERLGLKDANAVQTISFPDRQSFGGGVSLTFGICCLGLSIGRIFYTG